MLQGTHNSLKFESGKHFFLYTNNTKSRNNSVSVGHESFVRLMGIPPHYFVQEK